jgi:hydrogenase maturation protein HypF
VSPDIGTCDTCRKELSDPSNRRFGYPFINCTDCGPRFSIIEKLPYDRGSTTMKDFPMCPECAQEYSSLAGRRYHAQPNACAHCGPALTLVTKGRTAARGDAAMLEAVRLLAKGRILAVKGIGGFHIACDALNARAVARLRKKKHRPAKPFAVMAADETTVRRFCEASERELALLFSPERPIVLLRKKPLACLDALSPDNNYLGVMAPYSPLHYLLFGPPPERKGGTASVRSSLLVMTSANAADEPVETDNAAAISRLAGICDHFLVHDRTIANRCDDSIAQVMDGGEVVLRRGRGYSPFPFFQKDRLAPTLACGAELKSTFCLCRDNRAILSQYIGDLKTYPTFSFYKEAQEGLAKLSGVRPKLIACDLHPDYLSTRFALGLKERDPSLRLVRVQHHRAHVASVMAEHGLAGECIGVCFDGAGYGDDGTVWGGEFFRGGSGGFERVARLEPVPMPGGDRATQEPWRMAVSYLHAAFGPGMRGLDLALLSRHRSAVGNVIRVCETGTPLTSSCGRLFDAVSAILGLCDIITYEAQAAVRLQKAAELSPASGAYRFGIENDTVRTLPVIRQLVADMTAGADPARCALKFHTGLCDAAARVCARIRSSTGIATVCLSGGVFQNRLLLETLCRLLRKDGFTVFYNQLVPANDGGVALGQAWIANHVPRGTR